MPDGDIVRCQFARRFLRPYRKLCLEQFDAQETTKAAIRAVRETLKEDGDAPLQLIRACTEYLHDNLASVSGSVDYGALSRKIDAYAQQYSGNPRAMELAKKSVKQEMQAYRNGQGAVDNQHIAYRYVMNVYQAEFAERAPLARKHWYGQPHSAIETRLNQLRPYVEKHAERFAQQAVNTGSLENLTLHRMPRPRKLRLHEELF